ncbi:MAG: HGxxPAAW family protein [Actinomycetales bacterium]|jgi:hypothetical protein
MADHGTSSQRSTATAHAEADEHFESHGHSVAAWILVAFLLIGSFIVSLGIVLVITWLDIVGVAFCVVGLILGRVLQMAGFGVHAPGARAD